MIARLVLAGAFLLAAAGCSKGGVNHMTMSSDVADAASTQSTTPADAAVDRPDEPDVRPSALDANGLVVAPSAPPPPVAPASGPNPGPEPGPNPAPPPAADPTITLANLIGDVTPASNPDFAPIPASLGPKGGMYANKQALAAFAKMHDAAAKDGVNLVIISAFRSFRDQKRIWDDKWTGKTLVEGGKLPKTVPDPQARAEKILEFSSMPGTSRHHWGTDFDLNDLNNSYFASGKGREIHDWLMAHGAEYGFCQVYSPKGPDRPRGYNREDWHWSYIPVASRYLAAYPTVVGYERLKGFEGAQTAREIDVIPNYVQGINPDCRHLH